MTAGGAWYLDSSAIVKLVVRELHSAALCRWGEALEDRLVTSTLAETEVLRAVRRTDDDLTARARLVLGTMDVIAVESAHLERAGTMLPAGLRTLDAIHLAVALDLGRGLQGLVTYDDRQAEAARAHAVAVMQPT